MNLNSIPAFDDNYIWVLNDEAGRCLIVDPGDAEPVLNAIAANNWQPEAIFLTHHHHDHVGGVKENWWKSFHKLWCMVHKRHKIREQHR